MSYQQFLTDRGLQLVSAKEFKEKTGITKSDYRFVRDMALSGVDITSASVFVPASSKNKAPTLHQFIQLFRNLDAIYITRRQVERMQEEKNEQ